MANPEQIWAINSEWCQGVGPGYWPVAGAGLSLTLTSGTAFINGVIYRVGASILTMVDNTTNYIYLNSTGNPASKTTTFTAGDIPIAVITTAGGVITNVEDDRDYFFSSDQFGPYIMCFSQGDPATVGRPAGNEILLTHKIPSQFGSVIINGVTLPASLTGSTGGCKTNPTSAATITIKKNTSTTLGTINISTGGVMTFTFASPATLVPGDILDFVNQTVADATLAGIFFTISGARS